MRKVLVVGSGGAGKSTFARRLGGLLDIEVVHLDSLYWQAGWVETPKAKWAEMVAEAVRRDAWVMDGNYSGTLDIRLKACDTLILLDMSRLTCLRRVLRRFIRYRGRTRPDMTEGCEEQLHWEFILWIWNYPKKHRPKVLELMREHAAGKQMIRLRSPAEAERYLAAVKRDAC
ncbi:MAG TPA: DNA topology modulation protein [Pyrinomonadaceae bacterium]|jgi:adenylate kinase family enzyme